MSKSYTYTYQLDVSPYDKIIEVLEAFFLSLPDGDYTCEHRERYKLHFRRGLWKKSMLGLGQFVPDRLVKGEFSQWPIKVRVLVRPSGTEPLIRVLGEAETQAEADALCGTIASLVRALG